MKLRANKAVPTIAVSCPSETMGLEDDLEKKYQRKTGQIVIIETNINPCDSRNDLI